MNEEIGIPQFLPSMPEFKETWIWLETNIRYHTLQCWEKGSSASKTKMQKRTPASSVEGRRGARRVIGGGEQSAKMVGEYRLIIEKGCQVMETRLVG